MKKNTTNTPGDNLLQQITNITKAHGFDIVSEKCQELEIENKALRARVKYLEELINEYTLKMKANLSGGKVDEFLKEQITDPNDIPPGIFEKPGNEDLENTIN